MFRARLSWTLLGGVGLLGLTGEADVGLRGVLFGAAGGLFVWLNRPLAVWIVKAREDGDPRWQPMAIGFALRVIALVSVIIFAW